MALNFVTLVPGYVDGAGEPVRQGKVSFTPVSVLLAAAENLIVTQSPVVLDLSTGVTYVTLLATDNADLNPGTWAWEVQPLFPGAPPGQQVFLNYADGATQYLADLQPAVGAGSLGEGATIAGTVILNGTPPLQIQAGAAAGDVLASDASGNASWASLGAVGAATAAALSAETTRAEAAESAETSRAQAAETLAAQKAANLGDLANAATARTNLGLTGAATAALPLSIANGGTGSGTQPFVDLTTGQSIAGVKTFTGEVVVPAPVNPNDAATKSYADAIAQGIQVKGTVRVATAGALASYTATSSTLTASANGALILDGVSASADDRALVKDESAGNAPNNGIYTVTATGSGGAPWVLDRAADMDSGTEVPSAFTFVQAGTANPLTGWVCTTLGPVTLGTTDITWAQFSAAGTVTAGSGLSQAGSVISLATPVTIGSGGTGAGSQQAAIDALTGTQSAGKVLRSDGTHATLANLVAGDIPSLSYLPVVTAAISTGTSDNGPAINTAISGLPSSGGTILIPPGQFTYSTAISLQSKTSVTFLGLGVPGAGAAMTSTLQFTGTGSGSAINCQNSNGVVFRNLTLTYNQTGFTGILTDWRNVSGSDTSYGLIENCYLGGAGISSATSLVNLDKAINFTVRKSNFSGATYGIYGKSVNSNYSNAVQIKSCAFHGQTTAHLYNAGQAWRVSGCTFESLSGGAAGAYGHDSGNKMDSCTFTSNWLGDASGGTQFTVAGTAISFLGNYIGQTGGTGIYTDDVVTGLTIIGNDYVGSAVALETVQPSGSSSATGWVIFGNSYTGVTSKLSGNFAAGTFYHDGGVQSPASGTGLACYGLNMYGGLGMVDGQNISAGITTGTKIGTATGQKFGFWNQAPIIQPSVTGNSTATALSSLLAALGTTATVGSGLISSTVSGLADPFISVKSYGAKGDGAALHGAGGCNITASSSVLSLPGLSAPSAPSPTFVATGGTVADGTYQVKLTYTTAYGESLPSSAGSVTTSGGGTSVITIPSPPAIDGATGWYAYVTQVGGSTYTRQQPSGGPSYTGTSLVLTAPPTNTGAAPPALNSSMPLLFSAGDVGKTIVIFGAGAAGANLVTTIATFTSTIQVSLAAVASTTVTNSAFTYYSQIDSTSVQNAVAAALTAAGKTGGATLYFPPGGYVMSGVTFGSRLTIAGAGKDSTFFIMDPAATTGSVTCRVGPAGTTVTNCTLRDLTIDGNKYMWDPSGSQKGYGYYVGSGVSNQISQCQVINVKIRNCLTYGLDIERAQYTSALRVDVHDCGYSTGTNHNADGITAIGDDITLTDCRAWNNAVQGIRCGQSAAVWHRVQVIGCQAWGNASKGISLGSDTTAGDGLFGSSVIGGTYFSNGDAGIYLTSNAISCTVSGATAYNNATNGILLNGALYCTVTGNTLRDNATSGSSNPEIYLSGSSAHNTVTGNTVTSANAANAVKEQNSSSDWNTVTGNSLTSTSTAVVLAGTHSMTSVNTGFDSAPLSLNATETATDRGFAAWTFDPKTIGAEIAMGTFTSGNLFLTRILLRQPATVSTVTFWIGNQIGTTLTSGQNFIGLYDSGGTLRASTADQTTAWTTSGNKNAQQAVSFSSSYSAAAGYYWIGFLCNYTGTGSAVTPLVAVSNASNSGGVNLGLTASTAEAGFLSSVNTALPSSFTPSGIVTGHSASWPVLAALS